MTINTSNNLSEFYSGGLHIVETRRARRLRAYKKSLCVHLKQNKGRTFSLRGSPQVVNERR